MGFSSRADRKKFAKAMREFADRIEKKGARFTISNQPEYCQMDCELPFQNAYATTYTITEFH